MEARDDRAADEPEQDSGAPSGGQVAAPPALGVEEQEAAARDALGPPSYPAAPLLEPGNPPRLRGASTAILGSVLAMVAMGSTLSPRLAAPLGLVGVLVAVVGLLDLLGSFDDPSDPGSPRVSLRELGAPLALAVAALGALVAVLRLAVAGYVPVPVSAVSVPALFVLLVGAVFSVGRRLGPWRYDEAGMPRPLLGRHGFWLCVAVAVVYLPMLGNHSLIDPWETHYGEVAREMLARNDWISLWWAHERWFWSKPVLTFWIQAIPMALLGVRHEPGQMLAAAAHGLSPQPEWAVRLPIFLVALAAHYLLYKAVARSHGRRAGLLGSLVLLTMPQWFLVAHQTMTDMPFAACLAAAVALFLLAMHTPSGERARVYEVGFGSQRLRLSLYHLVVGAILIVVVPQILYLVSRHVTITFHPWSLVTHGDSFAQGSPINCVQPGNEACRQGLLPVVKRLQPGVQALLWIQALALMLRLSWGERRVQRLLFLGAWLALSLATLAKGPAGVGLPVLAALAYLGVTGRWRDLARMEIVAGALLFVCVVLPWFVAMYARHGQPFTDRLLFHDMFKRAFEHVHDTNKGDDTSFRYYLWQLGYATFPWSGLAGVGLGQWLSERRARTDFRYATSATLLAWFVLGFALFALMGTKFHHYCLPIVPPAAMLTGILLDDLACSGAGRHAPSTRVLLGAAAIGAAVVTLLVGRDLAWSAKGRLGQIRLMHLFTYNYGRPWPESLDFTAALWAFAIAAGLFTAALLVVRFRRPLVVAVTAFAMAFAVWGIDVYFVRVSPHWGQRELVLRYEQEQVAEPGPLVAYQLNWKGENFYRGNAVATFVQSGTPFKEWVDEQKQRKVGAIYFLTEHGRTTGLAGELGNPEGFELLTTKELNNKFVLVRVRLG